MKWVLLAGALFLLLRRPLVDRLAEAIGDYESDGNYQAIGPNVGRGSRAYGKYQVMDYNVGPWTLAALGRALTPSAFLQDPHAQDVTARHKVAEYLATYGNPADVASVWFSGRPLAGNNSADVTGTTVPSYVQAVLARL